MTNREWLQSLSDEDFAWELNEAHIKYAQCKGFIAFLKWLKSEHTEKRK